MMPDHWISVGQCTVALGRCELESGAIYSLQCLNDLPPNLPNETTRQSPSPIEPKKCCTDAHTYVASRLDNGMQWIFVVEVH